MHGYNILSLDGGGIKGLFTAILLDRLLNRYPTLLDRAELIAGTSSGGILALGLAAGRLPAQLAALYRQQADSIFDDTIWDDLADLGKAVGADYSHAGLRRVLRGEFSAATLGDLDKQVVIPTFDLDSPATNHRPRMWKPKFFHNFPGPDSDSAESVVDVALRTSSAPTYFPSHQGYIDGGVVANNPSMAALSLALDERAAGRRLNEIVLLSIGAGSEPKYVRGRRKDWGWAQWARPLVSLMISGVMGVADYQCRQILGRRYLRLDAFLERGVDLDDTRPETLSFLVESAEKVDLDPAVAWLMRRKW